MTSAAAPAKTMGIKALLAHQDLLKIIVNALSETIKRYTQTPVAAGTPFLRAKAKTDGVAVGGLIRLDGAEFALELFLGFSKELFSGMYENMFQMPIDEISAENQDLAGEILNIAFGAMDPAFRALGYRLNSSFPKIYSGAALVEALSKIQGQGIVVPYTTADGKPFVVELYSVDSMKVDWQYDPGVKQCG